MCGRDWGGFGGVSLCCVWDSVVWVWGSEYVLCVGQFGAGLGERVCAVCGRVWGGNGGVYFVLCVVEFCVGLGE